MADQNWDTSKPIDHTKVSVLPAEIRGLRSSAKSIIQKEHVALGADNLGGQHLKGSARVYMSDSVPTTDPESNNLDTAATSDDGRLAVVTAASTGVTNVLKVYMATAAGISTGWEGIRVAEAGTSNRVRLANEVSIRGYRATGVSTTISLIKVAAGAAGLPHIGSGSDAILMTSDAPSADSHVANKKYVDDTVDSTKVKAWVTFDASGTILDSFNVTSVERISSGNFTITWDTPFADTKYACVVTGDGTPMSSIDSRTAGTVLVDFRNSQGTNANPVIGNVIAIGDQ